MRESMVAKAELKSTVVKFTPDFSQGDNLLCWLRLAPLLIENIGSGPSEGFSVPVLFL
jgi:hypothetical protein